MTINNTLVRIFARNIFLYGTERLTARDGFSGIPAQYQEPVKQNAAETFSRPQIDNALGFGYVTDTEHADTIALV